MGSAPDIGIDHDLHDALVDLVSAHGPHPLSWLARRVRRDRRDPRIDEAAVLRVTEYANLLVVRPDGLVAYLGDVLDGIVLTHRVRGSLTGRNDLWLGPGAQPLLAMAAYRPLPLTSGGEARIAESLEPALVGPPGWLPDAARGDVVGLRWHAGQLEVSRVDPDELAGPVDQQHVRTLLAERCHADLWLTGDDPDTRAGRVVRALGLARLEDPALLSEPHPPLDELLHDAVEARRRNQWPHHAAALPTGSTMPRELDLELRHRAEQHGMTVDEFVSALLARRTPSPDVGPREQWLPDGRAPSNLVLFPGRAETSARDDDGPEAG